MNIQPIKATAAALILLASAGAAVANDEYSLTVQHNLAQIGVTKDLHGTVDGTGVGIAIFDSEIDPQHNELKRKNRRYFRYGGFYGNPDSHGTHVAGIAAAKANRRGIVGVAPGAYVHNIPMFDDFDWVAYDGGRDALSRIRVFNRRLDLNIAAVNMSYGPSGEGDVFAPGELNLFDDYVRDFVIVRAAGNDGASARFESYSRVASRDLGHVLVVGSVDRFNRISDFSNTPGNYCIGTTMFLCSDQQRMMNFFIVAPGDDITSSVSGNGYETWSGTSMATPHVTGAVALIVHDAMIRNTPLTPSEIVAIIKRTATDLGAPGVDSIFGHGLLNVPAALSPVGRLSLATGSTVTNDMSSSLPYMSLPTTFWSNRSAAALLDGLVLFDEYGRPYEANVNAFLRSQVSRPSDRVLAGLAHISGVTAVDMLNADHAILAWSTEGLDGVPASSMYMVAPGYDLGIGIGDPNLFLSSRLSANPAARPQRFGQIMFSSLGEAGELFSDAVASTASAEIVEGTRAQVFAMTNVRNRQNAGTHALLEQQSYADADASFAAFGLAREVAQGWSLGASYAVLHERGSVAGALSSGALSLGDEAVTRFQGVNLTGDIGENYSLAMFYTQAEVNSYGTSASLFDGADGWRGDHYGIMLDARDFARSNDLLRVSLAKPLSMTEGSTSLRLPVGRELDGTVTYVNRTMEFDSSIVPLEATVSYVAATGAGTAGFAIGFHDTNVNGEGTQGFTAGVGFSLDF